jgi:hypothetical protein
MICTPVESKAEFDARIALEEKEAQTVVCPLPFCAAQPGQCCVTDAGEERIRHCRRLMLARKQQAKS